MFVSYKSDQTILFSDSLINIFILKTYGLGVFLKVIGKVTDVDEVGGEGSIVVWKVPFPGCTTLGHKSWNEMSHMHRMKDRQRDKDTEIGRQTDKKQANNNNNKPPRKTTPTQNHNNQKKKSEKKKKKREKIRENKNTLHK